MPTLLTCDRCGPNTRACWIVYMRAGSMSFCKHCFNRYYVTFASEGYRCEDLEVR